MVKKRLDTKDDQIHDLHKEMGAVKDRERQLRLELNYLIKENEHLRNDASMLHNKVPWWEKKNRVEEETRKKELFEKKQRARITQNKRKGLCRTGKSSC